MKIGSYGMASPVRFSALQRIEYQRNAQPRRDGDFFSTEREEAGEIAALRLRQGGRPACVLPRNATHLNIDVMATDTDAEPILEAMAERRLDVPLNLQDIQTINFSSLDRATKLREILDGRSVSEGEYLYSWEVSPDSMQSRPEAFGAPPELAFLETRGLLPLSFLFSQTERETPFIVETEPQPQAQPV